MMLPPRQARVFARLARWKSVTYFSVPIICLVAWGQAAKTHTEKILILQKRVMRLMNFANFGSHAVPYFVSSNVLPINLLFYKLTSLLILDVHITTQSHLLPQICLLLSVKCTTITHAHQQLVITISIILEQINIKIPSRESECKSGIVFPGP